jgi:hypothetical protein
MESYYYKKYQKYKTKYMMVQIGGLGKEKFSSLSEQSKLLVNSFVKLIADMDVEFDDLVSGSLAERLANAIWDSCQNVSNDLNIKRNVNLLSVANKENDGYLLKKSKPLNKPLNKLIRDDPLVKGSVIELNRIYFDNVAKEIQRYIIKNYGLVGDKMKDAYTISKSDYFGIDLTVCSNFSTEKNESIISEIVKPFYIVHDVLDIVWKRKRTDFVLDLQYYYVPIPRQFHYERVDKGVIMKRYVSGETKTKSGIDPPHQIFLWRGCEEIVKLGIHEIIHLFDDSAIVRIRDRDLYKYFSIDKTHSINLFEARTEGLACLINTMIICANIYGANEYIKELKELWRIEKLFGLYQFAKLLYICGIKSFNEFCDCKKNSNRITDLGRSVEYFIFKSLAIFDLTKFLGGLKDNDGDIFDLIIEKRFNKKIGVIVDTFIGKIDRQDKNSILFKTGRQTILERDIGLDIDYGAYGFIDE